VFASVTLQVSLAIAVDVQPPDLTATADRVLPNGRVHGLPFPWDVARQTDVHREQLRHLDPHRETSELVVWGETPAAPLEPCGADAFGAPSKKNATGT